jgi:hypothetical protein
MLRTSSLTHYELLTIVTFNKYGHTYGTQLKWLGMEDVRVALTRIAVSPLKEGDTPLRSRK